MSGHHRTVDESSYSAADHHERQHERQQQQEFHILLKDMMYNVAQRRANANAASHIVLGLFTAPLMTLTIALQASLPQNRVSLLDIMPDDSAKKNERARVTQLRLASLNITNKAQLMASNQRSALWRPFKPPSYTGYSETLRALYRQGMPMSLYKGNLTRSIHLLAFHELNTYGTFTVESLLGPTWKKMKEIPLLTDFLLASAVDMVLQPLHVAETRMTIQNRTRNFAIYHSLKDYFIQTPLRDMFRGCLVHMPRNMLIALQGLKLRDEITMLTYFGQTFVSQTLAYPFMLVQRRLETLTSCQRLQGAGLCGVDESPNSFVKMWQHTFREEGLKGFYRGYACYMVAIMFWMAALPMCTDFMMTAVPNLLDGRTRQEQINRVTAEPEDREEDRPINLRGDGFDQDYDDEY